MFYKEKMKKTWYEYFYCLLHIAYFFMHLTISNKKQKKYRFKELFINNEIRIQN